MGWWGRAHGCTQPGSQGAHPGPSPTTPLPLPSVPTAHPLLESLVPSFSMRMAPSLPLARRRDHPPSAPPPLPAPQPPGRDPQAGAESPPPSSSWALGHLPRHLREKLLSPPSTRGPPARYRPLHGGLKPHCWPGAEHPLPAPSPHPVPRGATAPSEAPRCPLLPPMAPATKSMDSAGGGEGAGVRLRERSVWCHHQGGFRSCPLAPRRP